MRYEPEDKEEERDDREEESLQEIEDRENNSLDSDERNYHRREQ